MNKFLFFGVVAVLLVGGVWVFLFLRGQSAPSVALDFSEIDQVFLGEPFSLELAYKNDSEAILKSSRLTLALPDGVYVLGSTGDQRVVEELIGDLGPGSLGKKSYDLIAVDTPQSLRRFEAKLFYSAAPNEKIVYEKKSQVEVAVGQPVVGLEIEVPESVFSGESFEVAIKYKNNSDEDLTDLGLKIEYPPVFQFQSSNIKADKGNNYWEIPKLIKGEEGNFIVSGILVGQENSAFSFPVKVERIISGKNYQVIAQAASVGVSVSSLSITPLVQGESDYVAKLKDNLRYTFNFKNNADFALQNITVRARFKGEMLDFSKAKTNGSFNSITNTFSWTVANDSKLATLAPGGQGSVSVDIPIRETFPIKRFSDKNYTVLVEAQVESPTIPPGTVAEKTISVSSLETKIAGAIKVDARAYFRDAASGILNNGPFPPRVNQPTNYTIHWVVTNYATDMEQVKISAFLKSGAKWTGVVKSNGTDILPKFNPSSNEVVWEIPEVLAGSGLVGDPLEAIFQIELTPAINQVGQYVEFLGDTGLRAQDVFVNLPFTDSDTELTTRLSDDPTISGEMRVMP